MTSIRTAPRTTFNGTSTDPMTIDIDRALQRGRRLRASAFASALKSLFRSQKVRSDERRGGFSPDCAAPA